MTIGLVAVLAATPTNGGSIGVKIVLQGDTGLYLCRINRGPGLNPIEWRKKAQMIPANLKYSKMTMTQNGMFLSRIHRNGHDAIDAGKSSIDQSSKFNVTQNGYKLSFRAPMGSL